MDERLHGNSPRRRCRLQLLELQEPRLRPCIQGRIAAPEPQAVRQSGQARQRTDGTLGKGLIGLKPQTLKAPRECEALFYTPLKKETPDQVGGDKLNGLDDFGEAVTTFRQPSSAFRGAGLRRAYGPFRGGCLPFPCAWFLPCSSRTWLQSEQQSGGPSE